jgi:hypothetical protein
MAKAVFHRGQKVYVRPVGTWALIEKVNPIWAKGFDEPVRITYDCGLGRDFTFAELNPEDTPEPDIAPDQHAWRLMRGANKWQTPETCTHHPYPGSHPVVVTDENDWGGWRVPAAEYDRDPALIEMQARLIAAAPRFLRLSKELTQFASLETEGLSEGLLKLVKRFEALRKIIETQPTEATPQAPSELKPQTAA